MTKVPCYRTRAARAQALVTLTDSATGKRKDYWLGPANNRQSRARGNQERQGRPALPRPGCPGVGMVATKPRPPAGRLGVVMSHPTLNPSPETLTNLKLSTFAAADVHLDGFVNGDD